MTTAALKFSEVMFDPTPVPSKLKGPSLSWLNGALRAVTTFARRRWCSSSASLERVDLKGVSGAWYVVFSGKSAASGGSGGFSVRAIRGGGLRGWVEEMGGCGSEGMGVWWVTLNFPINLF